MAKIISFANQKGGVGKTTTAINISAAMGRLGKRVLLVDMDPQGNATAGLGITKNKLSVSGYDALIQKSDAKSVIHKTKFTNLSIMPSNILLAGAELDLSRMENQALCAKKMLARPGASHRQRACRIRRHHHPDAMRILRAGGAFPADADRPQGTPALQSCA